MDGDTTTSAKIDATEFSLLKQRVGGIETALQQLTSKIDVWMTTRQQNPWRLLAICLGVLVPLGWLINLYITTAISPVAALAVQAKTGNDTLQSTVAKNSEGIGILSSQAADSKRDRDDQRGLLQKSLEVQTGILERFARADAERQANEREVETQIDAMNQSLSVQFANQQRENSEFRNALHDMGAKIPMAPNGPWYFPNISNRSHHGVAK